MIGINKEGSCHAANGEFLAIAVKNCAAQGLNAELIATLVTHTLCKRVALNDLQIGITKGQHNEHDKHQKRDPRNAPLHRRPNIFHWFLPPALNTLVSSYHKRT